MVPVLVGRVERAVCRRGRATPYPQAPTRSPSALEERLISPVVEPLGTTVLTAWHWVPLLRAVAQVGCSAMLVSLVVLVVVDQLPLLVVREPLVKATTEALVAPTLVVAVAAKALSVRLDRQATEARVVREPQDTGSRQPHRPTQAVAVVVATTVAAAPQERVALAAAVRGHTTQLLLGPHRTLVLVAAANTTMLPPVAQAVRAL